MGLFDNNEETEPHKITLKVEEIKNEEIQKKEPTEEVTASEEAPEVVSEEEVGETEDWNDKATNNESIADESDDTIGNVEISNESEPEPKVEKVEDSEPEIVEPVVSVVPEAEEVVIVPEPIVASEPEEVDESTVVSIVETFEKKTLLKCRACKHKWFSMQMENCPACKVNPSSVEVV